MFRWPLVYDIWNVYLTKFIARYVSFLALGLLSNTKRFRAARSWSEHEISSSSVSRIVLRSTPKVRVQI